jgi:hypothetical protein
MRFGTPHALYRGFLNGKTRKSARRTPLLSLVSEAGLFFRMPAHTAALPTDSTHVAHAEVPVQSDFRKRLIGPFVSIG